MYPKLSTKTALGLLMWMLPLLINRCSALLPPKEAKSNFLTLLHKKNHKNQGFVGFYFFKGTSASLSSTKVSLFVAFTGDSTMSWLNDLIISHIHYRSLMKATTSLGRQTRTLPKLPRSSILMGINKRYSLTFVCVVVWHGCFFIISSYDCVVIFLIDICRRKWPRWRWQWRTLWWFECSCGGSTWRTYCSQWWSRW